MQYFTNIYNRGIVWMGHVPHKDVPKILNQSRIFVMPTWRDGFEIALMEAVASGVPSITTGAYERKEIYKDLVTFCTLNNPKDLADKIAYVIENWEEQNKKAQRASEIARKKFSWDSISKGYLKVFEHVLEN
jgi:glycosyltransferase involved in cell wall biosynthesis